MLVRKYRTKCVDKSEKLWYSTNCTKCVVCFEKPFLENRTGQNEFLGRRSFCIFERAEYGCILQKRAFFAQDCGWFRQGQLLFIIIEAFFGEVFAITNNTYCVKNAAAEGGAFF